MTVGLGTGSTATAAIEELARRVKEEGLQISGIPTSFASEMLARRKDIPITDLRDVDAIDIALDGADEVDPGLNVIKGRGAAHTREKVIASLARRFVVLVDETKLVDRLGESAGVPVEVLPMAVYPVMRAIERRGGSSAIRMGVRKDGPVVTDQGLWVLDAQFGPIEDVEDLDRFLNYLPGVLDHGLFIGMATDVFVGGADGDTRHLKRAQ